jgi:TPR repeat protein
LFIVPSFYRVTPQVPQNMQDGLQRMELEAREVNPASRHGREPSLSHYMGQKPFNDGSGNSKQPSHPPPAADTNIPAYQDNDSRAQRLDTMAWDSPSFSPFPKVKGDNIPPNDDEKEEILWNARKHVLHSQNVNMQITWARDVLSWAEISAEAAAREDKPRVSTPRIEHELRVDALNIINYLARQEHPDALYLRSKWLEFGKFGNRTDKREAFSGYKKASELGNARSEYRMGMLFEQSNDMSKAREHYYRGLSLKDSASLYRMGMMTLLGQHGEPKDYPRGLERIQMAADSADEDAPQGAYVYGMLVGRDLPDIQIPEGLLPHNSDTARMYIEKAAYLGFAKAQLKMGQAYELCQFGCELNPSFSLHYYGLAAKQGLPEAALGVSRWFLFGYEGVFKKNEELAFKYALEAANAKLATGAFAIGYYHEIGIHVNKNINEARRWYQTAAEQGNTDAISRLESLEQDRSLSKEDHETTTLTRIKSQHGSMRGKRPDRFKQPLPMAAVVEGSGPSTPIDDKAPRLSPQPSPGGSSSRPHSRQGALHPGGSPGYPAGGVPPRSQSAAPYPEDDRPPPLNLNHGRPVSSAPYPEDDVRGPNGPRVSQAGRLPVQAGPVADRPGSAFGIRTQPANRPLPGSQSLGNLHPASQPDLRGRIVSGPPPQAQQLPFRQSHMGPPGPAGHPYGNDPMQGRPASAAPYPQGGRPSPSQPVMSGGRGGPPPGGDPYGYGRNPQRPPSDMPPNDRYSRLPPAGNQPHRVM